MPASNRRLKSTRSALVTAFLERFTPVLERLGETAPEGLVIRALSANEPTSGLARLLAELGPLDAPVPDPLTSARARGALAKRDLIEDAGGTFRVSEVAELLGITRQAVDGRRNRGSLLAIQQANGEWVYPACQFTEDGVLGGLDRFLKAFSVPSPWTQLAVLLAESARLDGRTPLNALRDGDVEAAAAVARGYGEHAA